MKKIITALFGAAVFACASTVFAQVPCLTEKEAQAAADSIYKKGATFTETVAKTRPSYADWRKKQYAWLSDNVKFGQWYVSYGLPGHLAAKIDPSKNPVFDKNAIWENENVWHAADIVDGQPFDIQPYNPRYLGNMTHYLHRGIEAKADVKISITFANLYQTKIFLNGKLVYVAKERSEKMDTKGVDARSIREMSNMGYVGTMDVVELDLKKGENSLDIQMFFKPSKGEKCVMFSPYADPSIFLAEKIKNDFPFVAKTVQNWKYSKSRQTVCALFSAKDNSRFFAEVLENLIESSMFSAGKLETAVKAVGDKKGESAFIERVRLFESGITVRKIERELGYDVRNVRAAMEDASKLAKDYDKSLFGELKKFEAKMDSIKKGLAVGDAKAVEDAKAFREFAAKALLANPLLKQYPNWVFVRRDLDTRSAGLPANWQGNTSITNRFKKDAKTGEYSRVVVPHSYKDQLWGFDIAKPEPKVVFKPEQETAVSDIDISYDGKKVLFSSVDDKSQWNIDELDVASGKVKQITPRIFPDIDNYDGVYLPDGQIIYCSSGTFVGVPCVAGTDYVPNLFKLDPSAGKPEQVDKTIRQLTFEQDADWMPVVMENGRVLYTRWEYTDNSHYFSRILMHMNPDGTAQSSFYGSTSYWPNSLFYCRPIPGDPNKFVGIVSGHHGIARTGELHLFDVSKGTVEEKGRLHKFPSYGRTYDAKIMDQLVNGKWPQIIHPYPLSEKYIVAAARESTDDNFTQYGGKFKIYLIDAFDNMVPIVDLPDANAMEPMPLQPRKMPQEIADKTNPDVDYGYVFLNDIYQGPGLKGVPRGTVKALRVIEYLYGYRNIGNHNIIGEEASWDIKRIHGTVPVEEDGSALFKVPANRPIAIQPLDKDGNALQLMRSWLTVMPGETQSCVGCHEGQGMSPTSKPALAARKRPSEIKKFLGDVRGYSFVRDVQPVLDKNCIGCHDGTKPGRPNLKRGPAVYKTFPRAYIDLMKYCRRPGPESSQHMLSPLEFHSSTSELIQLLEKGHKGVKLDDRSMEILKTWIDLNVPCMGTWKEVMENIPWKDDQRRMWSLAKYANRRDDQNAISYDGGVQEYVAPQPAKKHPASAVKAEGFPFEAPAAAKKRDEAKLPKEILVDMGKGVSMRLTLVPAGEFVQGVNLKFFDEGPATIAKVGKPFYMGQFEVTNKQYSVFDPEHDSGFLDRHWKDHVNQGYPANGPEQSVIRVSWNEAVKFCEWLSQKAGVKVSLPTETQWEWAARAGSATDFWFGKVGDNYGVYENLADWNIKKFAVDGIDPQPVINPNEFVAFIPADLDVDDGHLLMTEVGQYKANPFGLYDINGNVSEWTADNYTEYLGGKQIEDFKSVRGGSWRDRAKWARVTIRRGFRPWQKVYNVGFRVVIDDAEKAAQLFKAAEPLPEPAPRNTVPRADTIGKKQ